MTPFWSLKSRHCVLSWYSNHGRVNYMFNYGWKIMICIRLFRGKLPQIKSSIVDWGSKDFHFSLYAFLTIQLESLFGLWMRICCAKSFGGISVIFSFQFTFILFYFLFFCFGKDFAGGSNKRYHLMLWGSWWGNVRFLFILAGKISKKKKQATHACLHEICVIIWMRISLQHIYVVETIRDLKKKNERLGREAMRKYCRWPKIKVK